MKQRASVFPSVSFPGQNLVQAPRKVGELGKMIFLQQMHFYFKGTVQPGEHFRVLRAAAWPGDVAVLELARAFRGLPQEAVCT